MSLPWSAQQVEWLQAMGLDVLRTRAVEPESRQSSESMAAAVAGIPAGLARVARGIDLAPLVERVGIPRDAASRRRFWRALRPLRKASRPG
ncbi:hypothetical protein [Cognatilysobacter lacus]|uniref:Uncharacterized protein n=1 Tax=Cognatilysobacter lacus TaxID=1643323 RepID=A0A5D8Z9E6_9GAMM|nr:hypothetical protein [Lysobacter lacus]TZF91260.1 hypothetical protein FW784_02340 [Lysobacter lacus]